MDATAAAEVPRRVVVPIVAGIGNAVMTIPLVRRLAKVMRREMPEAELVIAARTGAMADVFERLSEVDQCVVLGTGIRSAAREWRTIVRPNTAWCVIPFPSNRWQYTLLAASSRAKQVVMHDYPVGRFTTGRFLLRRTTLVPARCGVHDVEQNLDLLRPLDDQPPIEPPRFPLRESERTAGNAALRAAGVTRPFLAIQAGCGRTVVGARKRWPVERWAELATIVWREHGLAPVVVEGPDERGVGMDVAKAINPEVPLKVVELRGALGNSAAILEKATLYAGTDSGLAHVSAAVGTPPVTLFAAADPVRVCPFGYADLVVTPRATDGREWSPLLRYPMDAAGPKLRRDPVDWPAHISVEDVAAAVAKALSRGEKAEPAAGTGLPAQQTTKLTATATGTDQNQ